ncbi:response regulator transcription factor [Solirubrobacter ginsenosidimutans]|uniref:response regulator transcription factor n=1 Tax=Solirubrobacter ginsenosidimutans TaxID=490573 RepID=UPI00355842D3
MRPALPDRVGRAAWTHRVQQLQALLRGRRRSQSESGRLTARELEILQLAADGMSGPQIAEHLVLSPGTIKTHFQHIYAKCGVSDRAGAVAAALCRGLID